MTLVSTLHVLAVSALLNLEAVHANPPDFSSSIYPRAPRTRHFKPSYDFCIVGGGTAGLVLGNRLSESQKHNVVVFEAGSPPTDAGTYGPAGGNQYGLNGAVSPLDWNFQSVPQVHMNNRTFSYHRGKCLGGSSATNGLFYGRGSKSIYDQWETDGNPGWNWDAILKAAIKGTTFVGDPTRTNDNTYMTWDPALYSDGPLEIGFQGKVVESNPSFMNALSAIGVNVVEEQNGGNPLGIKQGTMTLDRNFFRSSSYDSYLEGSQGRSNLDVLDRAPVLRILFNNSNSTSQDSEPRAVGVTFLDYTNALFHNISCTKEVIMSAGAFHTPFLLKQSGIGPAGELEKFGIEPIVVNENVGQHMQDHTAFSVIHKVKPELATAASTSDIASNMLLLNEAQMQFYSNASYSWASKWSAPSGCTNGFKEYTDDELRSIGAGDVVNAGLTKQAHLEILYESIWYPVAYTKYGQPYPNESYISVTCSNMAALSRGNVTLASNNPLGEPVIDPNYLAEKADQALAIQCVKELRKIMGHPEMQKYSAGEVAPGANITSDEEILEYAKTTMVPNWHASSTARMLPREKGGVIDSTLRVYGTRGLRVCDVSTLGRLPDVNLVGPVYAVAELGAEVILKDYA